MRIKIDSQNIVSNARLIKSRLNGGVKLCGVVKANAYGHGLKLTARCLENEVDCFAVARLDEAISLGKVTQKEILILDPPLCDEEIALAAKNRFVITVNGNQNAAFLSKCGVKCHLKADSGMNRLGIGDLKTARAFLRECRDFGVDVCGVYSHFACTINSDPQKTFEQFNIFQKFVRLVKEFFPDATSHVCNTAGALFCPAFQLDMVRVGIGLFGACSAPFSGLRPCKTVTARVVETKTVKKGGTVGYDCAFRATKKTNIAIIDCGYGDGIPRRFCGFVATEFGKMPVIGVCMDLTAVLDKNGQLKRGDEVLIFGDNGKISSDVCDTARFCDTISYEILCGSRNRR